MSAAAAMQPQLVSTERYGVATINKREGGLVHITNETYPDGVWVSKKDLGNARTLDALGLKVQAIDLSVLQEEALTLWAKDQASARELGQALIAVREKMFQVARGSFTHWYRQKKLSENRVNYCIRLVEGKINKSPKARALRPSVQFETVAARAVQSVLSGHTDRKTNSLNIAKHAVQETLKYVLVSLYTEYATFGVVEDPDGLTPDTKESWEAVQVALSRFIDLAYRQPEREIGPSSNNVGVIKKGEL
jgi:hypothetical protein